MKKILFLAILLIANLNTFAQSFKWAKSTGGSTANAGLSIAIDVAGNVFTTGSFEGTADFDPGPGIFNLTAVGGPDIFISKIDVDGNFVWAKSIGGSSEDQVRCIAIDASGNVFTTGSFNGTTDFDPGPGTFDLTAGSFQNIFISKLDAAGNFVWAKAIGENLNNIGISIAIDASGNVFTTGYFESTADFDPGPGIYNLTSVVAGNIDIFISKLDASGNFVWAKSMGGTGIETGTSIAVDAFGNVITTGYFNVIADLDPGPGIFNLTSAGDYDIFISKLDASGNFVWAKAMGGTNEDAGADFAVDASGNILTTGYFNGTADFDPGLGTYNLTSVDTNDIFISKLDAAGNFVWAKAMGGTNEDGGSSIALDASGNVFATGSFNGTADFDPGLGTFNLTSAGSYDIFISKLDAAGNFVWAKAIGGTNQDLGFSIALDASGNVYTTGYFKGTVDFDPEAGTFNLASAGNTDIFVLKLGHITAAGNIFNDLNANCINEVLENSIGSLSLIIQPGNIVVQTNQGYWYIDSLPAGTYTATVDTSGQWKATCSPSVSFTVVHPDSFVSVTPIGIKNINLCTEPEISIIAPFLRRCFSNQYIYVEAKNLSSTSQILYNSYADVKLDSFITINSSTKPYTSLGNYIYRFQLDSIYPGQSKTWEISTTVSCSTVLGQTLCLQANLFPVAPCVLDSTPTGIGCLGPWDNSFLRVTGLCDTDSIRFEIRNLGSGDMDCFRDIRLYIDGQFFSLDSIKLLAGEVHKIAILGDARTWRLEADQHPLVPGNSHPNATVELCGDSLLQSQNWTSNRVNIFPLDDEDPVVDIYCGLVMGSFDPNDKTGYPIGILEENYILPNQQLQYVIRFQNTGTDTAFKVVIRDTLETDLNIFSVVSGVSSHNYSFRMYGQRILEWTFNNILLPDSFVNEPKSHGFISFTVNQNPNLSDGTKIENKAAIYFDFNSPVITNTTLHTVDYNTNKLNVSIDKSQNIADIKVYPNPNNGLFKVELPSSKPFCCLRGVEGKITICNVMGQVIYISTLNDQSNEIDLSNQPDGIYFLKVENGEMEWNKKVVKN